MSLIKNYYYYYYYYRKNNDNKNFIEISSENLFTNLHTFHYNNKNNDNNNNNFFNILALLCIYLNFQFDLYADVC